MRYLQSNFRVFLVVINNINVHNCFNRREREQKKFNEVTPSKTQVIGWLQKKTETLGHK